MHERSLALGLVRAVEAAARTESARRVIAVRARVPANEAVSPEHLRLHFALAAAGTVAEGARLDVAVSEEGEDVILESIEIETEEVTGDVRRSSG